MNKSLRLAAFLVFLSGSPVCVAQGGGEKKPIRIGYVLDYPGGPTAGDNRDTQIATDLLLKRVIGPKYELQFNSYGHLEQLRNAVREGELDGWQIGGLDYHLEGEGSLLRGTPAVAYQYAEADHTSRYCLVARKGTTVADLYRGELVSPTYGDRGQGLAWAEARLIDQLKETQAGSPASFFSQIKRVSLNKPKESIFPVFFGNADTCLILDHQFETMKELNPQIGKRLEVLLTSPEVVIALIVYRPDFDPDVVKELIDRAAKIHEVPDGETALKLLGLRRFRKLEPGDLDSWMKIAETVQKLELLRGEFPESEAIGK